MEGTVHSTITAVAFVGIFKIRGTTIAQTKWTTVCQTASPAENKAKQKDIMSSPAQTLRATGLNHQIGQTWARQIHCGITSAAQLRLNSGAYCP